MDELKAIIAANIGRLRRDAGMTQLELAEKLNYSDKAVSKWERADAVPDITVLKAIADLFGVTLDDLVRTSVEAVPISEESASRRRRNHTIITGLSVLLVWLLATLTFVTTDIAAGSVKIHWMAFVYAVPVSLTVWLVFNSLWFDRKRNFMIISLLMWSTLAALFLSFLVFGINLWQVFLVGIPGQVIVFVWSGLRYNKPR